MLLFAGMLNPGYVESCSPHFLTKFDIFGKFEALNWQNMQIKDMDVLRFGSKIYGAKRERSWSA